MRNSTISTSISSVVSRVIDVVTGAGFAHVRLALAMFRERLGNWQEQYLYGLAQCRDAIRAIAANPMPGKPGMPCQMRHDGKFALAVFTPPTVSTVRALSQS